MFDINVMPLLLLPSSASHLRYGSTLIIDGSISFVQLMTAMLALMLGALGLGQALNDLGEQHADMSSTLNSKL